MPKLTFSSEACHVWEMQVDMDDETETLPWPNGGIILRNVKHDDYNLAKDIRIARIWIFGHDGEKEIAEDFKLIWKDANHNTPGAQFELLDFRLKSDGKKIKADTDQVHQNAVFRRYAPIGYIFAKYQVIHKPESYFFKEGDPPFFFEQRCLFCDYGRNPPHEPGAVLDAARMFPLTSFFTENPKVLRVRVDYRINGSLDVFMKTEDNHGIRFRAFTKFPAIDTPIPWTLDRQLLLLLKRPATKSEIQLIKDRPNQIGIFRDDEHLPGLTGFTENMRKDLLDDIFFAGEKPMPWEICSYGLVRGFPGLVQSSKSSNTSYPEMSKIEITDEHVVSATWDNLHWWGGFSWLGMGTELPSTPGAFHALHVHWRWGRVVGSPNLYDIVQLKAPQFKGNVFGAEQFRGWDDISFKQLDIGGPLVDSLIPIQTIRFCVEKKTLDKTVAEEIESSSQIFFESFEIKHQTPQPLFQGEDMVLWLSFEVSKVRKSTQFGGTIFIHGFYFAHNLEPLDNSVVTPTQGIGLLQYDGGRIQHEHPQDVPQKLTRLANGYFE